MSILFHALIYNIHRVLTSNDSRYHNKKNSLENWPTQGCFLMDYEARSRNLGAQQVRRRQSDHYLKDV
jgi:hypothetical protein